MERPTMYAEQNKHVLIGECWLLCECYGWELISKLASVIAGDTEYHGVVFGHLNNIDVSYVLDYIENFGNEDFHNNVIGPFKDGPVPECGCWT